MQKQIDTAFAHQTGVNQGCILSLHLFSLCIGWIMKNTAKDERGVGQTFSNILSDLYYVDDIYILAYHYSDMQAMAVELSSTAAMLGPCRLVGGYARVCVHVMVPGTSRGLHIIILLKCRVLGVVVWVGIGLITMFNI